MNRAAVSFVQRKVDNKILAVWNRRYSGWALPGGKVEEGERVEFAQARELREETGLSTVSAIQIYLGQSCTSERLVHVFLVRTEGEPFAAEPDCPVMWMAVDEFLSMTVFKPFYVQMFREFLDEPKLKLVRGIQELVL